MENHAGAFPRHSFNIQDATFKHRGVSEKEEEDDNLKEKGITESGVCMYLFLEKIIIIIKFTFFYLFVVCASAGFFPSSSKSIAVCFVDGART